MNRHHKVCWDEFHFLMDSLLNELKEIHLNDPFNMVVGISRGGLIPATIISHALNLEIGVISLNGFDPNDPSFYYRYFHGSILPQNVKEHSIILVDDIVDHGYTVQSCFTFVDCKITHPCCLYSKLTKEELLKISQNFKSCVFVQPDCWVTFPWEVL